MRFLFLFWVCAFGFLHFDDYQSDVSNEIFSSDYQSDVSSEEASSEEEQNHMFEYTVSMILHVSTTEVPITIDTLRVQNIFYIKDEDSTIEQLAQTSDVKIIVPIANFAQLFDMFKLANLHEWHYVLYYHDEGTSFSNFYNQLLNSYNKKIRVRF